MTLITIRASARIGSIVDATTTEVATTLAAATAANTSTQFYEQGANLDPQQAGSRSRCEPLEPAAAAAGADEGSSFGQAPDSLYL